MQHDTGVYEHVMGPALVKLTIQTLRNRVVVDEAVVALCCTGSHQRPHALCSDATGPSKTVLYSNLEL